jgi:hypothetical protein
MKMAPFDRLADPSSALRTELKAQGKRRRERLSSLAAAPAPLRRRNDLLPPLRVEELAPADLVGPARNVRRLDAEQIRAVAASIAAFGFCAPVLIGAGNSIVHGVISVEAARQLGLPRIPCIRVDHLTGAEQRLLRIALNRLGETGAWSLADLKIEFEELIVEQVPIEISGFSVPENQILLGDDAPPLEQGPLAPAPDESAVARPGDVFRLGDHRLVCGDATAADVFEALMRDDDPARLALTDEPYNVPRAK